ncbi:hypothetical protein FV218_20735 [Methylobacterium sp. WL69]|uniref:hypothetical protein n=1 Tax=Methylobacterium sp. WL69 TaxID=2603893 RepID=UPI0011C74F58|nr:hypothetical protein [Methylobacterium sp. WL69]TXM66059.1 hypothetical protein FV218_20735 [Methylobacterium sp. WL69]
MSRSRSLTSIDVSEYDRIETAMSESARGRWFLDEYARRTRADDTQTVLSAIARLETVVTSERDGSHVGRMRGDLMDMANAIARTKAEIAALGTPDHENSRLGGASMALDAIVRSTERATSDILGAAEDVQETAWTLRESGSDAALCDALDQRATEIYTACSFQDLTAQRTARIIHTLRYLEERVASMMAIWGDSLDTVPPAPGESASADAVDLSQSDVDRFIDAAAPVAATSVAATSVAATSVATVASLVLDDETVDFRETESEVPPAPEAVSQAEPSTPSSEEAGAETPAATDAAIPADGADAEPDDAAKQDVTPKQDITPKKDIAAAFADIDALSEDEKLALFS